MSDQPVVLDTPYKIAFGRLAARKGALKLEVLGMKRRGRTAYSICKQVYGIKGRREAVLATMEDMVKRILAGEEIPLPEN